LCPLALIESGDGGPLLLAARELPAQAVLEFFQDREVLEEALYGADNRSYPSKAVRGPSSIDPANSL
jgi:hypothetical protein